MMYRTQISIISSSIVVVALFGARPAHAQRVALNADSLLHRGLIERAESVYYADARMRPRDPVARWNLGTYLIERGAQRIGMTLVEEAQQFGFDKGGAGRTLAPVYLDLGEYGKLLTLPVSPLNAGEKQRARYLEAHPTRTQSPDSTTGAAFTPAKSGHASLGTLTLHIHGRAIEATIVNSGAELVLSGAVANAAGNAVHRFASESAGTIPAVIDSIEVGRLTMMNVPVTVSALPPGSEARISLAFLARYAPTFDPRTRMLTLHASGNASRTALAGNAFSTLVVNDRYSVLRAGGWSSVDDPKIMSLLSNRRWTLDAKHGAIVVSR